MAAVRCPEFAQPCLDTDRGARYGLALNKDGHRRSAYELLAFPDIGVAQLARIWPQLERHSVQNRRAARNRRQIRGLSVPPGCRHRRVPAGRNLELPADFDYARIKGLSNEARAKLAAIRPSTVGQAGRIDGMTPAALSCWSRIFGAQGAAKAPQSPADAQRIIRPRACGRSRSCAYPRSCFT